jgi:hypothetical protein
MSDALVSGLLGGAMGLGQAAYQVGKDNLEAMRTRLRDEAKAELQRKRDELTHGQTKELQINRQDFESGENEKNRASREKVADLERQMELKILSERKRGNDAKEAQNRLNAIKEAVKAAGSGAGIEEINAILTSVGLPEWEEFISDPGSSGFLGIGGREPKTGYRVAGSGSKGDQTDFDALLAQSQQGSPKNGSSGLISEAQAAVPPVESPPEKAEYSPNDPGTWDVTMIGTNLHIITPSGPVKMTEEQIEQWKQTEAGKTYFGVPDGSNVAGMVKDTETVRRRRQRIRKSFSK